MSVVVKDGTVLITSEEEPEGPGLPKLGWYGDGVEWLI